jgi:hypothetical protein
MTREEFENALKGLGATDEDVESLCEYAEKQGLFAKKLNATV